MLEKDIESSLSAIAAHLLEAKPEQLSTIGIKYGRLGLALFHLMYYQYREEEAHLAKGDAIIRQVVGQVLEGEVSSHRRRENLMDFGRFLEFINRYELFECPTNPILESFDEVIQRDLTSYMEAKNFNVIDGAISMGDYFFARLHSKPQSMKPLNELLSQLEGMGFRDAQHRLYWKSVLHDQEVLLGFHGSCAIALYACKMMEQGQQKELARQLILDSLAFVEAHRIDTEEAYFPVMIGEKRNRWPLELPYGDLFVAYTYYRCGRMLEREDWQTLALEVARLASKRVAIENVVVDAGFAHGIMGTALLFDELHRWSQESFCLEARNQCYKRSLQYFHPTDTDFYKARYEVELPGSDLSFLSGIAGIGAAYLYFLDPQFAYYRDFLFVAPFPNSL